MPPHTPANSTHQNPAAKQLAPSLLRLQRFVRNVEHSVYRQNCCNGRHDIDGLGLVAGKGTQGLLREHDLRHCTSVQHFSMRSCGRQGCHACTVSDDCRGCHACTVPDDCRELQGLVQPRRKTCTRVNFVVGVGLSGLPIPFHLGQDDAVGAEGGPEAVPHTALHIVMSKSALDLYQAIAGRLFCR